MYCTFEKTIAMKVTIDTKLQLPFFWQIASLYLKIQIFLQFWIYILQSGPYPPLRSPRSGPRYFSNNKSCKIITLY